MKPIIDAERTVGGGGDDLEKNGKREGGDKDSTIGQTDASSLKIELLKVRVFFLIFWNLFHLFMILNLLSFELSGYVYRIVFKYE